MDMKVARVILKNDDILENTRITVIGDQILVFSPGGSCLSIPPSMIRAIEFDDDTEA